MASPTNASEPTSLELSDLPDHLLDWAEPDGGTQGQAASAYFDGRGAAAAAEAPPEAFACTRRIRGKVHVTGVLTVAFTPGSQGSGTFRITFDADQKSCRYNSQLHVAGGLVNGQPAWRAAGCHRSGLSRFALSCDPYLGSDLIVVARGFSSSRSVRFRVPWYFHEGVPRFKDGIPDERGCRLPFIVYTDGQATGWRQEELTFDYAACQSR